MKKQRVECQHEEERIQEYNLCIDYIRTRPSVSNVYVSFQWDI